MSYREQRWAVVGLPLLVLLFLSKSQTLFPQGSQDTAGNNAIRGGGGGVSSESNAVENALSYEADLAPSYIQLCSELLRRDEVSSYGAPLVVREQQRVCDALDSFSALVTMIASTWIAQTASRLNLFYRHGCRPLERSIRTATIQQMLPTELALGYRETSLEVVQGMCRRCMEMQSRTAKFPSVDCLGFPVLGQAREEGTVFDRSLLANILASFHANLEEVVKQVVTLESTEKQNMQSNVETEVVVYLGTESESNGDRALVLPLLYYGDSIPPSVESISIVLSPSCSRIHQCQLHSQIMSRYFVNMYPRSRVQIESVTSTVLVLARVMMAPTAICPPSSFCLLPALTKDPSHTVHLTEDPIVYPWFSELAKYSRAQLHLQSATSMPVHVISSEGGDAGLESFLLQRPAQDGFACQTLRGRVGHWEQDLQYAQQAQYVTPLKRFRDFPGFVLSKEEPFRTATTFQWIDDLCSVRLVSRDGLCSTMQSLGLTRIYIVGDSLNMQMAQSLWKLLGHEDDPVLRPSKAEWQESMRFQWNRTVECPSRDNFELVYTRNDLVDGNDQPFTFDKIGQEFNCGFAEYCLPWVRQYADYQQGGTLLIANAGSHLHKPEDFARSFDEFLGLMDRYQKPGDVVMVRTTVPGHNGCQDPNVMPYSNHPDFAKDVLQDFRSWHLFSGYNDYMDKRIRERNNRNKHLMHVLDVYPMTVLRKDGHISGPQKCSTCKDDDCLHYILPGPLDWWAHLMHSNLANMASIASRLRPSAATH